MASLVSPNMFLSLPHELTGPVARAPILRFNAIHEHDSPKTKSVRPELTMARLYIELGISLLLFTIATWALIEYSRNNFWAPTEQNQTGRRPSLSRSLYVG